MSRFKEELIKLNRQDEEERAKNRAEKFNLPYQNLETESSNITALAMIPEAKAKEAQAAVLSNRNFEISIAVFNPDNPLAQNIINEFKKEGYKANIIVVSLTSLKKIWQTYSRVAQLDKKIAGSVQISQDILKNLEQETKNLDDIKKRIEGLTSGQISQIVDIILAGGLNTGASDIHIEVTQDKISLRYRIDGILHDVVSLSSKIYPFIISRIKLISGLKFNITNVPQDGRFTIHTDNTDIEIRVSCLPSPYGENIVMRILNPKDLHSFEELGLRPDLMKIVDEELQKPNGLIINTGPTGSGKSTSLFAFLKKVSTPEIKTITLEDPIEYHLENIIQTQIDEKRGFTFAKGLRSIFRQDPDIILVGEIRDAETAQICIQASLTGHLIFSTLHTNDAAGAVPRLIELGVKPMNLAPALSLIMAQRLVRKICDKCKEAYAPKNEEISELKNAFRDLTKEQIETIGLKPIDEKIKLYRGKGCPECNNIGYRGRIAIFEMFSKDEEMEKLITASPSHIQIFEKARKNGMLTVYQDGLLKALNGITTLDEVKRVALE